MISVILLLVGFIVCIVLRKRYCGANNYLSSLSKKNSLFSKSKDFHSHTSSENNNNQIIARHYSQTSKEPQSKLSAFNTNYGTYLFLYFLN